MQGLYGYGQDTIAKSCMSYVAERKRFCGGILYVNMQGKMYCG